MNWEDMAVVGQIARTHGLRGQVFVNPETDFPEERFRAGAELFLKRGLDVESVRIGSVRFQQGRPVVALAGVESIDDARALAGLELRVPPDQLVGLPRGTFYRHDLVGCRVETRSGDAVGVVMDVEGTPEASRLIVRSGEEEIQIPLASSICTGIDAGAKRIVIEPIEGLLDLNK